MKPSGWLAGAGLLYVCAAQAAPAVDIQEAAKAGKCATVLPALQAEAKAGNAAAQLQLGAGARAGHCLTQSEPQAFKWYYAAAE